MRVSQFDSDCVYYLNFLYYFNNLRSEKDVDGGLQLEASAKSLDRTYTKQSG